METLEKQIGNRLRERRDELNLTQSEVASEMGVAVTTVQRLESGETQPRIDTLLAYCRVVGLSVDDVASNKSEPPPVRVPSNGEILETVKNALKVSENPLIQLVLSLEKEHQETVRALATGLKAKQDKSQNVANKALKNRK